MKTLAEHMAFYGCYHRDRRNRLTHFFGVPAIIFALLIPLSLGEVALGGIGATPAMIWAAGSIAALGTMPALSLSAVVFIVGWIVQLIGHRFEGNKPALTANLFQTLVSPIFLTAELFFALGFKRGLQEEVERRIVTRDFPGAENTARNVGHA